MRDDDRNEKAPAPPRSVLRLVPSAAPEPAEQNLAAVDAEAARLRPKSKTAQFLAAYADAIDRDIKLLLDL
jgi:hypothetical protein